MVKSMLLIDVPDDSFLLGRWSAVLRYSSCMWFWTFAIGGALPHSECIFEHLCVATPPLLKGVFSVHLKVVFLMSNKNSS